MKPPVGSEEHLVQLATRVPRGVIRRMKEFCVRHDVHMQTFVRHALTEKLARAGWPSRQRSRS